MFAHLSKLRATAEARAPAYALLRYDTDNVGDDIQALAALRFMPRVDFLVLRDALSEFRPPHPEERDVRVIMNGWFMGRNSWPPAAELRPLFISFHISNHRYSTY